MASPPRNRWRRGILSEWRSCRATDHDGRTPRTSCRRAESCRCVQRACRHKPRIWFRRWAWRICPHCRGGGGRARDCPCRSCDAVGACIWIRGGGSPLALLCCPRCRSRWFECETAVLPGGRSALGGGRRLLGVGGRLRRRPRGARSRQIVEILVDLVRKPRNEIAGTDLHMLWEQAARFESTQVHTREPDSAWLQVVVAQKSSPADRGRCSGLMRRCFANAVRTAFPAGDLGTCHGASNAAATQCAASMDNMDQIAGFSRPEIARRYLVCDITTGLSHNFSFRCRSISFATADASGISHVINGIALVKSFTTGPLAE